MSEWTSRWRVLIECRSCNASFEHEHPDASREVLNDGVHRLVLIGVPDYCPRCTKQKVVDMRRRRPAG